MKNTLFYTFIIVLLLSIISVNSVNALSISCPDDEWVSCTDEVWDLSNYPNAIYHDYSGYHDAGPPVVEYFLNMCDVGTIERTWTVYAYGTSVSCTQTFYVEGGGLAYSDINWPTSGLELEGCNPDTDPDALPDGYGTPTFTSPTECTMIAVNYSDQLFTMSNTCKKILRKWQVMDWCTYDENTGQGIHVFTQVIKIVDGGEPVITELDDVVVGSLDCKEAHVIVPVLEVDASECGNVYTVNNNSPYADDNGKDASGVYPIGTTQVKYTIHYACGKKAYYTIDVVVTDDKNPTVYCYQALNMVLMGIDTDDDGTNDEGMVEVWASDLDYGSFHVCPSHYPLQLSFSADPTDNVRTFTCAEVGKNVVEMWVTDRYGNQDFCLVELDIQNNGANINDCQPVEDITSVTAAGSILTPVGEAIEDIIVELTVMNEDETQNETDPTDQGEEEEEETNYMKMSDRYGAFQFEELPLNATFKLTCEKEIDSHDFVTKEDVRVLYRHIIAKEIITNRYLLAAADINGDGVIDRDDLYPMYDFAHGKTTRLGIEQTHVILPTVEDFSLDTYYNNEYISYMMLEEVSHNMDQLGFTLIVKGDLYSTKVNNHLRTNIGIDTEIKAYLEATEVSTFTLSPNPFHSEINIQLAQKPSTDVKVTIYNTHGDLVYQGLEKSSEDIRIDMDETLRAGLYYCKITYNDQTQTGKIIKM